MLALVFAQALNLYSPPPNLAELSLDEQIFSLRISEGLQTPLVLPLLAQKGDSDSLHHHLHISRKHYGRDSQEAIASLISLTEHTTQNYTDPRELEYVYNLYSATIQDSIYLLAKVNLAFVLFEYFLTLPLHEYQPGVTGTVIDERNMMVRRHYMMLRSCLKDYREVIENDIEKRVQYNSLVSKMNDLIESYDG